jgi:porin
MRTGYAPRGGKSRVAPRGRPRFITHGWYLCNRRSIGNAQSAIAVLAFCLYADPVLAAPPPIQIPTEEQLQPGEEAAPGAGPFGFLSGIGRTNFLLGNMWGLRPWLSQYGLSFALQETSEVLGNVTGGSRTGFEYDGLTQMALALDTQRAFDWYGGTFLASALQIHGRNLSADNLQTLQTASGIEADRATRLWELWYDQKFLEENRLDVKIGQQSLDQEFIVSQNALYLINTMFGWPMVTSADLPGGGPAYPLSALGARARARPVDPLTFLVGAYSGSPAPKGTGDPQVLNPSGLSFPLNQGVLVFSEMQYQYPSLGSMLYAEQEEPLGRTYKLGFWYDSENFDDLLHDQANLSLANPASSGIPRTHRGDWGVYGVADQLIWVDPKEADRTINLFFRALGAPQSDRNLITFSLNAGMTFHEPFLHRDDDTFALGMGYAKVSADAAQLDRDIAFFTGTPFPVRGGETFIEATYQYQAAPWWQLQPDMQYVFNPGAGVLNQNGNGQRVKNELVLGIRTNILF